MILSMYQNFDFVKNNHIKIHGLHLHKNFISILVYFMLQCYKYIHIGKSLQAIKEETMITIIIGTLLFGSLFTAYEYLTKPRRKTKSSFLQMDKESRVIDLPQNLEKEKKRRHIR